MLLYAISLYILCNDDNMWRYESMMPVRNEIEKKSKFILIFRLFLFGKKLEQDYSYVVSRKS